MLTELLRESFVIVIVVIIGLIALQALIVYHKNWRQKRWPLLIPLLLFFVIGDCVRAIHSGNTTELLWLVLFPILSAAVILFCPKNILKAIVWISGGALAVIVLTLMITNVALEVGVHLPNWFFAPIKIVFDITDIFPNVDFVFPPLLIIVILWVMVVIAPKSNNSSHE